MIQISKLDSLRLYTAAAAGLALLEPTDWTGRRQEQATLLRQVTSAMELMGQCERDRLEAKVDELVRQALADGQRIRERSDQSAFDAIWERFRSLLIVRREASAKSLLDENGFFDPAKMKAGAM